MDASINTPADLTHEFAHEIQAPLTSLELQLQKLSDQLPGSELAADCLEEIASLKRLVASFLELGAPEPPEPGPSAQELAPVFRAVERRFHPIAAARNLELQMDCGSASAVFDARATERILSNLVDNAIKFSRDRGTVQVFARTRAHNGRVEIEVRDEGIGLSTEARARMFEPFYRVNREVSGAGLGLAISKRLAEAQRGSLHCESDLGHGSSFILAVPAT